MAERINIDESLIKIDTESGTREKAEEKYKRYTFFLQPEQDLALDELKLKLKKEGNEKGKSELVREAVNDLLRKYATL